MNNSVLRFKNFNVTVGDDCIVRPQGCVVASKEITKVMLRWNMKKGIIPLGGSADGCKEMDSSSKDATAVLKMMGFPQKCPIPQGKKCPTAGIDISKYKDKLGPALGRLTGKVTADHGKDVGGTCFTFSMFVSKK
ncbi:uncharacterized protein [Anabrus simplex]|uniref:uncharacterized protein n=1 Tax=Anabrus simplex TaxID=316456 RepID=UPI0035A34CDA